MFLPWVDHSALLDGNVRGRKDTFVVLITEREPSVPATILLQYLDNISKPQREVRIGCLGLIAIDYYMIGETGRKQASMVDGWWGGGKEDSREKEARKHGGQMEGRRKGGRWRAREKKDGGRRGRGGGQERGRRK